MKQVITYSQNREDLILEAMLKHVKKGFFVDVGANHPVNHSVTKRFYDKGWRGINIEPIPETFEVLEKFRPNDTNLQICIGKEPGKASFRQYANSGISTLSQEMISQNSQKGLDTYIDYEVEVHTMSSVLKKYAKRTSIHFMKIDVEGLEYEVLESNDWKRFRPIVLCIEANHADANKVKRLLNDLDYQLIFNDGLNDYFVDSKQKAVVSDFNYPKDVLEGGKVIVPHAMLHEIRSNEEVIAFLRHSNERIKNFNRVLRQQVAELQAKNESKKYFKISDLKNAITRLVKSLKKIIKFILRKLGLRK